MQEPPTTIADLNDNAIGEILRHLAPHELAAVSLQDKRLRQLASDDAYWRPYAQKRWQQCDVSLYPGSNSWSRLYRTRASLPRTVPYSLDTARTQLALAKKHEAASPTKHTNGPHAVPYSRYFELYAKAMQDVCAEAKPTASVAPQEWQQLLQGMTWWLLQHPEVVMQFGRRTHELLAEWDVWTSPFSYNDVPWRRSALQYLLSLTDTRQVHPSVYARLDADCSRIDAQIKHLYPDSVKSAGSNASKPGSHWWWFSA